MPHDGRRGYMQRQVTVAKPKGGSKQSNKHKDTCVPKPKGAEKQPKKCTKTSVPTAVVVPKVSSEPADNSMLIKGYSKPSSSKSKQYKSRGRRKDKLVNENQDIYGDNEDETDYEGEEDETEESDEEQENGHEVNESSKPKLLSFLLAVLEEKLRREYIV